MSLGMALDFLHFAKAAAEAQAAPETLFSAQAPAFVPAPSTSAAVTSTAPPLTATTAAAPVSSSAPHTTFPLPTTAAPTSTAAQSTSVNLSHFNNLITGNFWPPEVRDNSSRFAICLVGEARAFATDVSLQQDFVTNVVNQIGADRVHVFVSSWNAHWRADDVWCQTADEYHRFTQGCPRQAHSYQDAVHLQQVFEELGSFVMSVQLSTVEIRASTGIFARCKRIGGMYQDGNFPQYSRMSDCLHQIRLAESTGLTYSWVVKLRPDIRVPANAFKSYNEMISELDPQAIYGQMWHSKRVFHDQFLAVHRQYSDSLLAIPYPEMQSNCYPQALFKDRFPSPYNCHDDNIPECFYTAMLMSMKFPGGLKEFPWNPMIMGAGR
jgi:hypothetical protein